jgi:chaperone modulatory protein CbpM
MNTHSASIAVGVCIADEHALDLHTFAAACGADIEFVRVLVDEGLVQPLAGPAVWHFSGEALARVRRIRRLQRDFEANLQSVAVMLDLIDEIERLHARLHRAGLDPLHESQPPR